MTMTKKPIAINLVQRAKKESTDRALFFDKKVSAPPVIVPRSFWWPSCNKITIIIAIENKRRMIPNII